MNVKTLVQELIKSGQLADLLKELQNSVSYQICNDCKFKFEGKRKKKCPKCKSTNVAKYELEVEESKDTPPKKKEQPGVFRQPARKRVGDGKKQCRTEGVTINTKLVDTNEFKRDTETFTKKVQFSVSQRRDAFEPVEIHCACGHVDYVHPTLVRENYKCASCILNR